MQTLGERYEAVFNMFPWKDEIFLALVVVIQRHYLASYGGAFAENFYALKRVKLDEKSGVLADLPNRAKLLSLLSLTLVPYLQTKLVSYREKVLASEEIPVDGQDAKLSPIHVWLKRALVKGVPLSFAAYETWCFGFKLFFMFNKTRYYSPSHWMQGVIIARLTGDDMRKQMVTEEAAALTRGLLGRIASRCISLLRTALIGSALVFKLVEWYYSPENSLQRETMKGQKIIPPAPPPPIVSARGIRLPRNPHLCPICHETRVNLAVSSSGVAFCYPCIHEYVQEHGECPVTRTPCDVSQIRRIFDA
mmetsp:Transcript_2102/g.3944  ORF Transcript_2102/g.3944 Transcript_2102/m.3944 type:complete len:306 (+) Transcript_2102:3564-4481(+)